MNRRATLTVRSLLLAAVVFGATLVPGEVSAASCFNGNAPVKKDVKLQSDITDCGNTNGIEVGKSGITIDLNGHTIDGIDCCNFQRGIFIDGYDDVKIVGPGTIQQFGAGILAQDADGLSVSGVTVTDNEHEFQAGIVVTRKGLSKLDFTDGVTLKNNTITLNDGSGILVHRSAKNVSITGNTVQDNGGDGIFVGGAGERRDLANGAISSPRDGLREQVFVSNVVIKNNTATSNDMTGIGATGEPAKAITITGNDASDNGSPDTGTATTGHEGREQDDRGGHGIKVAGDLKAVNISNNDASGNGPGATCSERNGAGILVAGSNRGVTISNNTTDDNAMAGVLVAGAGKNFRVANNSSVSGNNLNCEDDEGGIKLTGALKRIAVSGNVLDANGSGITLAGHTTAATISDNISSNNAGAGGGHSEDTAGILVKGRSLNLRIVGNTTSNNTNSSGVVAHGIDVRGSVRKVGDAKQALLIQGNTAEGNEGHGVGVFVEASRPIACGEDTDADVDTDPDCPGKDAKVGDPNPEAADQDCNNDADNVPSVPGNCPDETQNDVKNVRVIGNTANTNGTDGLFAITDVTFADNTANNNTDHGIEHNSDPTVAPRSAEADDGPHLLKDGGGNSGTGNATNCSAGLTC